MDLKSIGILEQYGVELIGAQATAIEKAEDREQFKAAMEAINIPTAKGGFVQSPEAAQALLESLDFPVIIRPSFTLGVPEAPRHTMPMNLKHSWKMDCGPAPLGKS